MQKHEVSTLFGGRTLTLSTGHLANQASGSVLARYGDTVVLATVCSGGSGESLGYFPLTVEYEERLYAGGKIKTSRFIKREGRPAEEAILKARLIDRSIRPLFPKDYINEVQVIATILSVDQENDPDIVAAIAVSAALAISDIPWKGPIGAVRLGMKEGAYIVNPVIADMKESPIELVVSSTHEAVVMIEAGAKEVPEDTVAEGIDLAKKENEKIIELIEEFVKQGGKVKAEYTVKTIDQTVNDAVLAYINEHFKEEFFDVEKEDRKKESIEFMESLYALYEGKLSKEDMDHLYEEVLKKRMRQMILDKGVRLNGRKPEEIRQLSVEVSFLPRTHGSAIFQRGETQILTIATLGSTSLQQLIEGMEGEEKKRYMHHYNFPPFSTGETKRLGSASRREIGHGALAEKALLPVIPTEDEFPYAIRLVSETLSSAGSTSMGSTCGSTLALMDAGVPIKAPVAGIAMGIITDGDKYAILSDIQDLEDFYGDMDFKVAGTSKGITAMQMDVKTLTLSPKILREALDQAKRGRQFILDAMTRVIATPRTELSSFAPRAEILHIDPKKIGEVIGPGGKNINRIIEATNSTIDIDNDGKVSVSAEDQESLKKAISWIKGITDELTPGMILEGKVTRIMNFGAFVEVFPGKEGLVHISEIAPHRIEKVEDELAIGQAVTAKVLNIDEMGRLNLTLQLDRQPRENAPVREHRGRPDFHRKR